jgi:hypothetical protein
MGFWKRLFGREQTRNAKLNIFAVDGDGDGKVQDGTQWERTEAMAINIDELLLQADTLLQELSIDIDPELEKKAKAQARAKKAAATRAANKAKREAEQASSKKQNND